MSSHDDPAASDTAAPLRIRVAVPSSHPSTLQSVEQLLNDAIKNCPTDPRLRYNLALLLCKEDKIAAVEPQLDWLIVHSPDSSWVWKARELKSITLGRQGRWREAKDVLTASGGSAHPALEHLTALGKTMLALALIHTNQAQEIWNLHFGDHDLKHQSPAPRTKTEDPGPSAEDRPQRSQDFGLSLLSLAVLTKIAVNYLKDRDFERAATLLAGGLAIFQVLPNALVQNKKVALAVALICILGGRREVGKLLCEDLQRRDSLDGDVARSLFVSGLAEAQSYQMEGCEAQAADAWREVIRNGVFLIHRRAFSREFTEQRLNVYRATASSSSAYELSRALEQALSRCLPADSYLGITLSLELASADAMKSLGGLPVVGVDGSDQIVCGVEMLRHLQLTRRFGDYIGQLCTRQTDRSETIKIITSPLKREDGSATVFALPAIEEIRRKACYFSRFGEAQQLIEQGYPQRALIALEELRTKSSNIKGDIGSTPQNALSDKCDEECENFQARDPANPKVTASFPCVWHDATDLTLRAHLAAADIEISKVPLNLSCITDHWCQALELSDPDSRLKIEKSIAKRALESADVFADEKRFDDQVSLVEAATLVCGQEMKQMLEAALARFLNLRGVAFTKLAQPDWKRALEDFSRAVSLNPYGSVRIRNLVIALRQRALDVYTFDLHQAAAFLVRAKHEISGRLHDLAYGPEFQALAEHVTRDAYELSAMLKSASTLCAASGNDAGELENLRLAVELVSSGDGPVASRIRICAPAEEQGETPVRQQRVRVLHTTSGAVSAEERN
jgi:hypothetical protein